MLTARNRASSLLMRPFVSSSREILVQRLHAGSLAGLDGRVHLRDLALANEVADCRGADHDLVGGNTSAADLLEQCLRDDGAQRLRQHRPDHFLLCSREHVDDTVDGLRGRTGVQRAENQVSGFRGGERQADGLEVTQLADQDDVGVFTQSRTQRLVEAERVAVNFSLIDERLLRLVNELDRILDRQDVIGLVLVDVIDHGREGGTFTRAGRSRYQHDAPGVHRHVLEDRRCAEVVQRQDLGRNDTEDRGRATILVEGVDAEARKLRNLEGEVGLQEFLVVLALLVIHDVVHHAIDVFVGQRRHVDALDVTVNTNHRRHATGEVQVRRVVLYRERQKLGNVDGHISPSSWTAGLTITRRILSLV